ncbi:MAG TPA: hypothetical protein VGQ71_01640, partial [Terriglobales bacterium]|nr:hypothetical protein [Terriglobales bacterium]
MEGNHLSRVTQRGGKWLALLLLACLAASDASPECDGPSPATSATIPLGLADSVRAHMEFLASDALQGRGSGTVYEFKAAEYAAAKLQQYGIQRLPRGSYVQEIGVRRRTAASPSVLSLRTSAGDIRWTHGREIVAVRVTQAEISGPLQRIDAGKSVELISPQRGAFVLLTPRTGQGAPPVWRQAYELSEGGAGAVLLAKGAASDQRNSRRKLLPQVGPQLEGVGGRLIGERTEVLLGDEALKIVTSLPEGT